ncbi:MAG TPA: hypothetical protein VK586_14480 [Streptosporangiaceae bacterium]|nr:hypothetical protein [Streptosporangiaceae bacterium]
MTAYTVQNPPHAGATLTAAAPAVSGNTAPCGNGVGLLIINPTGGTSITVNVAIPAAYTFDGLPIAGASVNGTRSLTVAAGPAPGILPLVANLADPVTGLATFAVTGTLTSVVCSVIAIGS